MTVGAILLNRYCAGCKKFQYTQKPTDLDAATAWLGKFWGLAGVVMILAIILFGIAVVYTYATGVAFAELN